MATIANTANNNAFISYGDVNFGRDSYQPEYSLRGQFVYDDAGRTVTGTKYTLIVKATFAGSSEAECAAKLTRMQLGLSRPRKRLIIKGLGFDLDVKTIADQDWGPKPLFFEWQPWGTLAWECVWGVEFTIKYCTDNNSGDGIAAFNFDTTWQNDFEGQTTRTIAGYYEVRSNGFYVADHYREGLTIDIPPGFKRINNVWHESADKKRLDFVVTDQQLEGDAYPPGITLADGYCDFAAVGAGINKGTISMGMTLKTAPEANRGLAGILAIQAMLGKQARMAQQLEKLSGKKSTIVLNSLHLRNGKFDSARVTEFSCSWTITGCTSHMLNSAGIWEPLFDTNYTQWRTSMNALWGNRGTARLESMGGDDVVLDTCSNVNRINIGNTPAKSENPNLAASFKLACPEIPEDGGWVVHKVQLRLLREDKQTEHRQALPFSPSPITTLTTNPAGVTIGAPSYSQSASEESVVEHHGYPEQMVLLQFNGLRFKHKPVVPNLKSVGGQTAYYVKAGHMAPVLVDTILGCPLWHVSDWVLYRVSGPVKTLKSQGSPTSCALSEVTENA